MRNIFRIWVSKKYIFLSIFLLLFSQLKAQVPIAYYDFENNSNRNTTVETTVQEKISTIGTPALTTSGLTAAHGTGNGATYSGSNTGYAIGYYGWTNVGNSSATDPSITLGPFNCTGFTTLTCSFDCIGIGSKMPVNVDLYYSTNGTTYTKINVTTTVTTAWTSVNIAIPAAADNTTTLYLRVVGYKANNGASSTNGVMKIDNFSLNATAITANTTLISSVLHGTGLSSGGSFIPSYTNLTINGSSIAVNAASNLSFTGIMTLTNGQFNVGAYTLTFHTGNTPIVVTAGIINLSTTSTLAFGTTGFTGGAAFTIPNNCFNTNPEFTNFTINRTNTLTLNNQKFYLKGIFTLTAGTLILPSNYIFTLQSTSISNTAMVAAVGATGNIQYNTGSGFTVERYIPQQTGSGVRAYRDISSSVNSGTGKIFDNWQESGGNGLVNSIYYGTHITGLAGASPGGVDATSGLDITQSGAKSLYNYDISLTTGDGIWNAKTSTKSTNDTLSAFKGYRITIRGNRLVNLYQSPQPTTMNAPATLRSTGKLVTGNVVFNSTGVTANGATNTNIRLNSASATGYTMIGNPYAAIVDWNALYTDVSTANISSTYTLYDPNVGTTGGYATYNQTTGITVPSGSAMNRYIQPGQAFFIQNTTTAPSITFKETHKSTNTANLTATFRTKDNFSKIYIDLNKTVAGRGNLNMDGVAVAYDIAFSDSIGEDDAENFDNAADNIAIVHPVKYLGIEGRAAITTTDTIKLFISQLTTGASYQLKINTTELITNGYKPYLIDAFTNTETAIALNDTTYIAFTTTTNPLSYNDRFYIVYRVDNALPITFLNFNGKVMNNNAQLTWNVAEKDISKYLVEKSENSTDFNSIATINAKGNNNYTTQQYEFLDTKPFSTNYYRIKTIATDGKISYSNVILLKLNEKKSSISIYPKPIINNQINLAFENLLADSYEVKIYNQLSQLVFETSVQTKSSQEVHNIHLPSLSKGNYIIQIIGTNYKVSEKIIIQ